MSDPSGIAMIVYKVVNVMYVKSAQSNLPVCDNSGEVKHRTIIISAGTDPNKI